MIKLRFTPTSIGGIEVAAVEALRKYLTAKDLLKIAYNKDGSFTVEMALVEDNAKLVGPGNSNISSNTTQSIEDMIRRSLVAQKPVVYKSPTANINTAKDTPPTMVEAMNDILNSWKTTT